MEGQNDKLGHVGIIFVRSWGNQHAMFIHSAVVDCQTTHSQSRYIHFADREVRVEKTVKFDIVKRFLGDEFLPLLSKNTEASSS